MKERPINWQIHAPVLLYTFLFLSVSATLIYSLVIDKHLSADGVNYFTQILDTGNFTYVAWSRQFGDYLTQWPLVLAVRLGLKHIPALSGFYGIGLYWPYIAAYLICIYAVRNENSLALMYFLVSIASINLSSDYILIGEHHLIVLLSWPILMLSLRKEPLNWVDGCLLWLLLIVFTRTYESAIIPALIFTVIFAARLSKLYLKSYKLRPNRQQLTIYSGALVLSVLSLLIAAYFILNPRDINNKSDFMAAILGSLRNEAVLISAIFTLGATMGLIWRKTSWILVSLLPIGHYAWTLWFSDRGLAASESFANRTLSLSLLPFLLISAMVAYYYDARANKTSMSILVLLILVIAIGNLRFSSDWYNFRQQFADVVTTRNGYVPVTETVLKDSPDGWGWNHPQLGIVWSYPCVKAIVLNSPETKWEPFNPREELILKGYVGYDASFGRADHGVTICK